MESHSRSLAKAISYRILASIMTATIVFVVNGDLKIAAGAGVVDAFLKLAIYFAHERVWEHISFGRPKPPEYEI